MIETIRQPRIIKTNRTPTEDAATMTTIITLNTSSNSHHIVDEAVV